jgi:hypothetical protein
MATQCDKCGLATDIPEAFFKERASFRRRVRHYCPQCHEARVLRVLKGNLWWSLGVGGLGLVLVLALPELGSGWFLLNVFLFEAFLVAAIVPHEFGHALVGRWLGLRVFKVFIGSGRTIARCKMLGIDTELKAVPLGGFTFMTPVEERWCRLKQFVSVLAGPLTSLVFCLLVLLILPVGALWPLGFLIEGVAPGPVFFYANLVILITNLWPHRFVSPLGKLSNDGRLLFEIALMKNEKIQEVLAWRHALEGWVAHNEHRLDEAIAWVESGLARFPDNFHLLNFRGVLLLETGRFQDASSSFETLKARSDLDPGMRAFIANNLAYAKLLAGGPGSLAEADQCSEEAMSLIGWVPAIKGTRGAVLLEQGRIEEALPLLRDSMERADSTSGKAQNACWIAIAECRRGRRDEASKFVEEARRLDPKCILLDRATEARQFVSGRPGTGTEL